MSTRIDVPEVDGAALPVGEATVVEHLQQDVEHLRVRLLDLVEQHDAVRATPHRLGELPALLVADVAGRGADEARNRVLLGVLGHVDPDHRALVVEQEVRERLGELGLADTGRAEEQERARRTVGVRDPRTRTTNGVGHGAHGPGLADQPTTDHLLHPQQLGGLALEQTAGGDAGPRRDHLGDLVGADLLRDHRGDALGPAIGLGSGLTSPARLRAAAISFVHRWDLAVEHARRRREVALTLVPLGRRPAARRGVPAGHRAGSGRPSPAPTGRSAPRAPPAGRRARRAAAPSRSREASSSASDRYDSSMVSRLTDALELVDLHR